MDEQSYDGTEQTPQPASYRPPPMHPLSNARSLSASSRRLAQESLWNNPSSSSLFSYSLGTSGSSSFRGLLEESLVPSLDPPSPISRPSGSLTRDVSRSRARASSRYLANSRQPPIAEVRVENDDDTFFECFDDDDDDRSLLQRTKRSLRVPTPQRMDAASVSPSVASSLYDESPSANATAGGTPSSLQLSRLQEDALQAILRLKEELVKSNNRNTRLLQEKEQIADDWQRKQSQWEMERKQLQDSLETAKASVDSQLQSAQQEQQKDFDVQLRRERKESMHRKLASDNRIKEIQHTLAVTTKKLEEATQREAQLEEAFAMVTRDKAQVEQSNQQLEHQLEVLMEEHKNDDTVTRLQQELEERDQTIMNLTSSIAQNNESHQEQVAQKEVEIQKWRQQYKDECEQHKADIDRFESLKSSRSPETQKMTPRNGGVVRFQDAEPLESSIADRLARMRDSAERAHLIKIHKREIARLKLDHDETIQKLVHGHQEAIRKAQKHADTVLAERLEELKKSLKEEYEEQVQETEERQREKFAQIQKEFIRNQESTDESLQAALSKISNISQQYEREANRRASLELSIKQLNHDVEQERERIRSRYLEDLEKRRREWVMERDTLLTIIQKDCNMAFEQHWRQPQHSSRTPKYMSPSRPSPTAVDEDFFPSKQPLTIDTASEPTFGTGANLISPVYSDIDDVLRETETLIQSMM